MRDTCELSIRLSESGFTREPRLSATLEADNQIVAQLLRVSAMLCALVLMAAAVYAQSAPVSDVAVRESPITDDQPPLIIEGTSASDVFGMGRSVIVRGTVQHGVVAFGGDVIVEGRVEGDAAAIGGSVIQRAGSYIGGDVIVLGGAYHHGRTAPERDPRSATVMYAGYEQELRQAARDPASLLEPHWSFAFLGHRLLTILFWSVVSLALTAAIPNSVGRAAARLRLTSLHVAVIGLLCAFVLAIGVPVSLRFLPTAVGTIVGALTMLLLLVAYLFGRVAIHAATGQWLQQLLLPERNRSESLALLMGATFWTVALSLPYIWPVVVAALLVISLGLALTAQSRERWRRPADA